MPNVGPMELAIVLIIALIVLGPKKLPEVGKSLGKGMREFKDSVAGITGDDDDERPREVHAEHVDEPAPAAAPAPVAKQSSGTDAFGNPVQPSPPVAEKHPLIQ